MRLMRSLFLGLFVFTQTFAVSAQELQLITYDIDEGLSRGLIKSVITDSIGFVWSATDEGVIKFDGQQSTFHKNFLPDGYAKGFFKKRNGGLLVIHDGGISEIVSLPDTAYAVDLIKGSYIDSDTTLFFPKSLYEDKHGALWVGENQAVVRFNNGQFKKFRFGIEDITLDIERSFNFAEDPTGVLWVYSSRGNLYYLRESQDRMIKFKTSRSIGRIAWFERNIQGNYYIGAYEGLFEAPLDTNLQQIPLQQLSNTRNVFCGATINDNMLYIGTYDNGLYRAPLHQSPLNFSRIEQLPFSDILNLHQDDNGLWLCSRDAIGLLRPAFFNRYKLNTEKDIDHLQDISSNNDHELVMALGNKVSVLHHEGGNWEIGYEFLAPDDLPAMQAVKDGDVIWIGTFSGEILKHHMTNNTLEKLEGISSGVNFFVRDLLLDHDSNVWVAGNAEDGVIRIDRNGGLHHYYSDILIESTILELGPDHQVYVGLSHWPEFLYHYNSEMDELQLVNATLPFAIDKKNFVINDLLFHDDHTLLMATSHGLLSMDLNDGNRITRIDLEKVPVEEPVVAVTKTSAGHLWVATTNGLVYYQSGNSVLYDPNNGMPSRTVKKHGLVVDQEDQLWVATARGLAYFKDYQAENQVTPSPIFEATRINGQKVRGSDGLQLKHNSLIELDYISLSYPGNRILYQTRILPIDSSWSVPTSVSRQVIPSLSPGEYRFEVRAQQLGGLSWSKPSTYEFTLARPWFQQWWAFALFLLSATALIIISVRIYNWRLIRHKRFLERMVNERTQEIQEKQSKIIEQKNEIIQHKQEIIDQNRLIHEAEHALTEAELYNKELKEQQLQKELDYKNKQLTTVTLRIIQKNETLKELGTKLNKITATNGSAPTGLKKLTKIIDHSFRLEKDWDEFKLYFEEVYTEFYKELMRSYPDLTHLELRHCALIKLNLSINESANILGISPESVKISRFRLKKKMELSTQEELRDYLMAI